MENFKLHFRGVPEEERGMVKQVFEDAYNAEGEKIPGEYEKNEEELNAISTVNNLVQLEVKKLGIESRKPIVASRIHFLDDSISKEFGLKCASFDSKRDLIYLNKDSFRRLEFYKTILHEIVHHYSFNSVIASEKDKEFYTYRSGYSTRNNDDVIEHQHFYGFNEAITEKITQEIVKENFQVLVKDFNVIKVELEKEREFESGYYDEIAVLNLVIKNMAKFYKKDEKEIWEKLKRGFFTGDMHHLRDIEKVFGPGSLRVLGAMTSRGSLSNIKENEIWAAFNKFFKKETNQEERNILAEQILSENEKLSYKKIKK